MKYTSILSALFAATSAIKIESLNQVEKEIVLLDQLPAPTVYLKVVWEKTYHASDTKTHGAYVSYRNKDGGIRAVYGKPEAFELQMMPKLNGNTGGLLDEFFLWFPGQKGWGYSKTAVELKGDWLYIGAKMSGGPPPSWAFKPAGVTADKDKDPVY